MTNAIEEFDDLHSKEDEEGDDNEKSCKEGVSHPRFPFDYIMFFTCGSSLKKAADRERYAVFKVQTRLLEEWYSARCRNGDKDQSYHWRAVL